VRTSSSIFCRIALRMSSSLLIPDPQSCAVLVRRIMGTGDAKRNR
jgi:hypothetical protein